MENIMIFNIPLKEFAFTLILLFSMLHCGICSMYTYVFLLIEDNPEIESMINCFISVYIGFFNILNMVDFPIRNAIVEMIN